MTESPPDAPGRNRSPSRRIGFPAWIHRPSHAGWVVIKVAGVLLFLAWTIGIPGSWVADRLVSHTAPFTVDCSRITWNPLRGFLLHHVNVVDPARVAFPLLTADLCILRPHYRTLLAGPRQIREAAIHDGIVTIPLSVHASSTPEESMVIHLRNAHARLEPGHIDLDLHAMGDFGTMITAQGRIITPVPAVGTPEPPKGPSPLQRSLDLFAHSPEWLRSVRRRITDFTFSAAPEAAIAFTMHADDPWATEARLIWTTPAFAYREESFSGARLEARYRRREIMIERIQIDDAGQRMLVEGRYHIEDDRFEARVYGDLAPPKLELLIPGRWRKPLDKLGLKWEGSLHAEGWIGPCPLAGVPVNWGGWIRLENARVNRLPVEKAFASIKRDGKTLLVQDGWIQAGSGPGRGDVTFNLKTDYETRISEGAFDLGLELLQLDDFLPRGLKRVARMFTITDTPIQFSGTFLAPLDNLDHLVVRGPIKGTNLSFRGASLTGANTYLLYSNNVVILDPFHVTCATGGVSGSLHLDLREEKYRVRLDINTNPQRVAPMAGTNFVRHFKPYHFSDDVFVRADGLIDVANDRETDLQVHLSGKQIGQGRFTFDHLLMQARRTPGRLDITNVVGSIYQGQVTGNLAIVFSPQNDMFDLDFETRDLSFDRLLSRLAGGSTNQYEGRVYAQGRLRGPYPDSPGWTNLTGAGNLRIEDGRLFLIPVFGGLSSLLSRIYPGLGFSEQNLAEATVTLRDGAIHTDDLKLGGSLLSLSAKGSYRWSDQLDFDVQVHPFRDGSLASAVRIVTFPISMLLEFHLTGPWRNPHWRAGFLP